MRVLWVCCLIVLAIAAVVWLRRDDRAVSARTGISASPGTITTASTTATASSTSDASPTVAHKASDAIQSSRAERIAESNAARTASSRPGAAQKPHDAQAHEASQETTDQEPPKSAGELFVPFIANDPAQVFAPATVNFHAAVQSEPVDPDWGPAAAEALRNFITSQLGERFEIPYIDCRQDLCEVQVAGRIGSDLSADMHDVQEAMRQMRAQPWWTALEFDQETGMVGSSPDGRVIVLWFLSRQ